MGGGAYTLPPADGMHRTVAALSPWRLRMNMKVFLSNSSRHLKEKKVLRLCPLVLLISTMTTARHIVTLPTTHLTQTRRDRSPASTVRKRRLTAWTIVRPSVSVKDYAIYSNIPFARHREQSALPLQRESAVRGNSSHCVNHNDHTVTLYG